MSAQIVETYPTYSLTISKGLVLVRSHDWQDLSPVTGKKEKVFIFPTEQEVVERAGSLLATKLDIIGACIDSDESERAYLWEERRVPNKMQRRSIRVFLKEAARLTSSNVKLDGPIRLFYLDDLLSVSVHYLPDGVDLVKAYESKLWAQALIGPRGRRIHTTIRTQGKWVERRGRVRSLKKVTSPSDSARQIRTKQATVGADGADVEAG